MFKSNVRIYTSELSREINAKKQHHTENCAGHMKRKKIPPMSTKNGLKLEETDKRIKDQNLNLTELEGALIAKKYNIPENIPTAKIKVDSSLR